MKTVSFFGEFHPFLGIDFYYICIRKTELCPGIDIPDRDDLPDRYYKLDTAMR
jgi:hypothetical protein